MKTIVHNKHEIVFYDNPQNLPIKRYQKFSKYFLIGLQIGETFEDFIAHKKKTMEFISKEMYKEARQTIDNEVQLAYQIYNEYSPTSYALAVMVHSIDGLKYEDYSGDGLQIIIDKLDDIGFTRNELLTWVDRLKKKLKEVWQRIFRTTSKTQNKKNSITD